MVTGTLKFKKDVRLVGETTIGNERRIRFYRRNSYTVAIDPEKLAKWAFVDVHFIHKAWVQGIERNLFEFRANKKN